MRTSAVLTGMPPTRRTTFHVPDASAALEPTPAVTTRARFSLVANWLVSPGEYVVAVIRGLQTWWEHVCFGMTAK
jgi:hypothetical protein